MLVLMRGPDAARHVREVIAEHAGEWSPVEGSDDELTDTAS